MRNCFFGHFKNFISDLRNVPKRLRKSVVSVESCFSDLSFQPVQVLQGSQELVEMSSASREWWSMIQSLSSDPSTAENRGSGTQILSLI